MNELRPTRSLLGARGLLSARGVPWPERGQLYGTRGLFRPRLGVETLQRMGPVRHALAQRAICGVVEVHAPFAPKDEEAPGRGTRKGA